MVWVPVAIDLIYTLGSLDVVPGESSTRTLFLRVMDTFLILILILIVGFVCNFVCVSYNIFSEPLHTNF